MKIDWLEYKDKDHVLAWVLVEVISKVGIDKFGKFDSSQLDVEFKVNGIEVPIVETFEFLQSQLENIENNCVKRGYREAMNTVQYNIDKLFEDSFGVE